MRTSLKSLLLAAAALPVVPLAHADEDAIRLEPGDGLKVVEDNCGACHSLDYIPMNSPFLDRKGWEAEVNKMVKVYGAPMEPDEMAKIVDYLATNYGKK
jgi:sulfite dehydrogenase (cytochrome) subunit B